MYVAALTERGISPGSNRGGERRLQKKGVCQLSDVDGVNRDEQCSTPWVNGNREMRLPTTLSDTGVFFAGWRSGNSAACATTHRNGYVGAIHAAGDSVDKSI